MTMSFSSDFLSCHRRKTPHLSKEEPPVRLFEHDPGLAYYEYFDTKQCVNNNSTEDLMYQNSEDKTRTKPKGFYNSCNRSRHSTINCNENLSLFVKSFKKKFDRVYQLLMDYYLIFGTIFFVLVMGFVLPDSALKINTGKELRSMKKMVNMMYNEVNRAEAACLTAADNLCHLQCSMQDGSTETPTTKLRDLSVCTSRCLQPTRPEPVQVEKKIGFFRRIFRLARHSSEEITIMSYVYTNSFDALEPNNNSKVR
ncbi:uncharacterized protein LOC106141042 [Amyelois transitella]|uniref:uncharacterized protein LOC106141042 n=1 Tax=Amyelois transitella TaxID=680683 RepID=UPI00299066CE|nr:uncharacterized protein LOC106141042 [Amyelois transitella]